MTPDLLTLLRRAEKALDDIGAREHLHEFSCDRRQISQTSRCTCGLEDEEEELLAVLKELNKVIQENA